MLQLHLRQVHLELFGDQHRDGCIGALAHLDIGHGQDTLPIAFDADKGIGREAGRARRVGIAGQSRQAQAEQQSSSRGYANLQEIAPGEVSRWWLSVSFAVHWRDAIGEHGQPPCPFGCAACLIASRMRT
jgi:hypothetical protein